jgi:MFS superfamily sulfate permease-like transporter
MIVYDQAARSQASGRGNLTARLNGEMEKSSIVRKKIAAALRVAPGLRNLLEYRREWLRHDAVAGVSVAAVALPTAIAYAELIGFEPVVGVYAAILPMLVFAIFGTSRHLIVNPDAATCAMVGTTLMPLTAGHLNSLMSLSIVLAVFTGILCILAGFLRLGFVADFLAKPILVGFLNGVAIHILLGQVGKVFGFSMKSHGIYPFTPGVCAKAAANPFSHTRRGRIDDRGDAGRQDVATKVARAPACGGAGS